MNKTKYVIVYTHIDLDSGENPHPMMYGDVFESEDDAAHAVETDMHDFAEHEDCSVFDHEKNEVWKDDTYRFGCMWDIFEV